MSKELPSMTKSGRALHAVLQSRRAAGDRVFGIIDSARDEYLARTAWAVAELPCWSLFGATVSPRMKHVAPWLVDFRFHGEYPWDSGEYLNLFADRLGSSSGILLISPGRDDVLWNHLHRNFRVADPDGKHFYFRYYDPRVLRTFLPTCTLGQCREFFGPVDSIVCESEVCGQLLCYSLKNGQLQIDAMDCGD